MDEKQCPHCKRKIAASRRNCYCGEDLLGVALYTGIGDLSFDTNLEPTIGIAPGVSMDITDGGINVLGVDGGHLASTAETIGSAAGAALEVTGDVLGGAAEIAGDVLGGIGEIAGDI